MCFEKSIQLFGDAEVKEAKNITNIVTPAFKVNLHSIGELTAEKAIGNLSPCTSLGDWLENDVDLAEKQIELEFKINTERRVKSNFNGIINSVDVFIEGELLDDFYRRMACCEHAAVAIKLRCALIAVTNHGEDIIVSNEEDDFELLRQRNSCRTVYARYNIEDNLYPMSYSFNNVKEWKLTINQIVVDLLQCHCQKTVNLSIPDMSGRLLETKLGADVKIVTKDNSEISAHACFLMGRSKVFERMFEPGQFRESMTRKIEMTDHSEDVIIALLEFVYVGNIQTAVMDPFMAVSLLLLADCYEIDTLKAVMKKILLRRCSKRTSLELCFHIVDAAQKLNDKELRKKAVDIMKWYTDDEIMADGTFKEVFQSATARSMLLGLRPRLDD